MFKPVVTVTLMTLFFTGILVPKSVAERVTEPSLSSQSRSEKYEKTRREELSMSFSFYGKIVDFDGNPVPGARVFLSKSYIPVLPLMNESKEFQVITDREGLFTIAEEGYALSVERIEKEGYEYHFSYSRTRDFIFSKNKKLAERGQFPDQPVVFKVRKKGTSTFVLSDGAQFSLQPGGRFFFDLLWQKWCEPNYIFSMPSQYKGWHPDLRVSLEGDPKGYRLILEALDADTGIFVDERNLYEAPAQGYRPKAVLPSLEIRKGITTFVYVKGRGGRFYTRMKVEAGADEKQVRVHLSFTTNPNGEGNFEASRELVQQYMEDVRSGKRRPYGYDPTAKPYTIEDVRKLLGK